MVTLRTLTTLHGKEVVLARIANTSGAYVELINHGATITAIGVPNRQGLLENVVLSYKRIEDYFSDVYYIGCTVGRVANRISGAQFTLDGSSYTLDKNDGENSNHGGFSGFNKKLFDYRAIENRVIFSTQSDDGEGGFPGNMRLSVAYSFNEENELLIEYRLQSDKKTLANTTNHTYFNLYPQGKSILEHELLVNADKHLELNAQFLPTGRALPIANTAFDFSTYKSVGQMMLLKNEPNIKGYNAYFIGKGKEDMPLLASLRELHSGRCLQVYATMPGVQVYTGDYLAGHHQPFEGLCLEAQFYPDTPNQPHFPSCVVEPNTEYYHAIAYSFGLV